MRAMSELIARNRAGALMPDQSTESREPVLEINLSQQMLDAYSVSPMTEKEEF
jgi:hypothetical protein